MLPESVGARPLLSPRDSPRSPLSSDTPRKRCRVEVVVALTFSVLVVLVVAARGAASGRPWWTHGQTTGQRPSSRRGSPVSSTEAWQRAPQSTFHAPQSRCSVGPQGRVTRGPSPPGSLPFLVDLSAEALPTKEEACAHCPPGGACNSTRLPQACCGVCQFEQRFCGKLYPWQDKSEAAAARFMAQGHALQDFTPCELFARIRGRTLWMLGDSQTWHFFYAVECFLREFAPSLRRTDPLDGAQLLGKLTTAELVSCYTPFAVPPICLELVHDTRLCVVRVDTADDMMRSVLPTLLRHVPGFKRDIMLYNTGLHYYEDVMCKSNNTCQVPGKGSKYVQQLRQLAKWRAAWRGQLPQTIWMDTPPQHFPGTGNWAGDFRAKQCTPLEAWQRGDAVARAGGTWNVAAAPLVPQLADAHLGTWDASVELWDSHMPGECTHWCQPSAYHLWVYLLNELLRDARLGNPAHVEQA